MRERPILLNADMVRAVLNGSKTQTRRIMREQPEVIPKEDEHGKPGFWIPFNAGKTMMRNDDMYIACPFGAVGDRLWVRETFCPVNDEEEQWIDYRATPRYEQSHPAGWDCDPKDPEALKWHPSIHMPRWASRITLEITGVRVERLQDISQADAKAEGCWYGRGGGEPDFAVSPTDHFPTLWASIYGEESWQANPWVWVIEFKRVEGE